MLLLILCKVFSLFDYIELYISFKPCREYSISRTNITVCCCSCCCYRWISVSYLCQQKETFIVVKHFDERNWASIVQVHVMQDDFFHFIVTNDCRRHNLILYRQTHTFILISDFTHTHTHTHTHSLPLALFLSLSFSLSLSVFIFFFLFLQIYNLTFHWTGPIHPSPVSDLSVTLRFSPR